MWCEVLFIMTISAMPILGDDKSSLGFVIDDTGSMGPDIAQVVAGADAITDIILNSRSSQIQDLLLITFNDPEVTFRTQTRNRYKFKNELQAISVGGGGDCPERSLTGIEMALKKSLTGSYLYVFTDDGPVETDKEIRIERIKYLIADRQTQIVFIITPNDNCDSSGKNFDAYYQISAASSGQVFRLSAKNEIKQVLTYVEETISGERTVLTSRVIPPDVWEDIPFTIDSKIEYAVVSTSGKNVQLLINEGPTMNYEKITWIDNVKVMKIAAPGYYSIRVKGGGTTSIVVFGRTDFTFEFGFSEIEPKSIGETAKQPLQNTKTYLAIKLKNKKGDVKLVKAIIMDMEDNVWKSYPLKKSDKDFYVTPLFIAPNMRFKITIQGYDIANTDVIKRTSSTPVEPINPAILPSVTTTINKAPVIKFDITDVEAEYKGSAKLQCKIHAYPKPKVVWTNIKTGETFTSEVKRMSIPYDFMSELFISSVLKNESYQCKAFNKLGEDRKNVNVKIITKPFLDVVSHPEDALVEFDKEVKFTIVANSYPEAIITWYKNAAPFVRDNTTELMADNSTLIINHMDKHTEGVYICEIRNDVSRKIFIFNVVLDIEVPKLNESDDKISEVNPLRGSDIILKCRILKGKPKPEVYWYFNDVKMSVVGEYLSLINVKSTMIGTYTCKAINVAGTYTHDIIFNVGEKPVLRETSEDLLVKNGLNKTLTCEVISGVPEPEVTWMLNGTVLTSNERYRIISDTLTLKPTITDNGVYTCKATNKYGSAHKDINLMVYSPLTMRPPNSTLINLEVNDTLILLCNADSYPRPHITWTFMKKISTSKPVPLSYMDEFIYLRKPYVTSEDEGYYTCTATSMGESISLTYEVYVGVPASIEKTTSNKTIYAVRGDLGLTIPCKASGYPTPDITWTHDDLLIPAVPDSIYIKEDGSLYIRNVDSSLSGEYICHAENTYGEALETYTIVVNDYPEIAYPTEKILLTRGETEKLECNLPHTLLDRLRWYKDNKFLTEGELTIRYLKESDSGIYVCRVSNVMGSKSASLEVTVGYPPYFTSEEETNFEYVDDDVAHLFCEANGKPTPVIEWMHNGKTFEYTEDTYTAKMELINKDQYTCLVSNELGNITREFVIEMRNECLIDLKNESDEYLPLIMSEENNFELLSNIKMDNGFLRMEHDDFIVLACADQFKFSSEFKVTATCVEGSDFIVDGLTYKFSELKCKSKIKPLTNRLGKECLGKNTDIMQVGYEIHSTIIPVYEICLDLNNRIPLYAHHAIEKSFSNEKSGSEDWYKEYFLPYDYESLYDCNIQNSFISSIIRSWGHRSDGCCFSKRQLVPPNDVLMGLNQKVTYNYINVLPQWGTCSGENWNELERRVRKLASEVSDNLDIWTGTSRKSRFKIKDSKNYELGIPRFFWKVVRDPTAASSLAIIQINDPNLKSSADVRTLCRDICDKVKWLADVNWRDASHGYTYCCNTQEFERAFNLKGIFDNENDTDLIEATLLPPGSDLILH